MVTGVGWVPVVSAVIESKDLTRGIRVTEHAIKVDHSVIFSAGADPRIDGLALDLPGGRKDRDWGSRNEKPLHRIQGAAENLEAFRMGALDELLMAKASRFSAAP